MAVSTLDPRVSIAPAYQKMKRINRMPKHTFALRFRPFDIQPFMLAPVLPGETMKNLLVQARIVTDPLAASTKLLGWWCEMFFFYVKVRDFKESIRDTVTGMFLDNTTDVAALRAGSQQAWRYTYNGGIDWMLFCMEAITESYFRDEGEAWNVATGSSGAPKAQVFGKGVNNWTDSLTMDTAKRTDREVAVPDNMSELSEAQQQWMAIRDAGLTDMDFEDYMRTYGVRVRQEETSVELHRPELLRYIRQFSYPTNTVEPTTGVPTPAGVWSIADRADKDRKFNEPGFIVGVSVVRPKVYFGNQEGSVAGCMDNQLAWLPAVLQEHYEYGFKNFATTTGVAPVISGTGGYWIDIRDIFIHGDQFINYPATANTDPTLVALPTSGGAVSYVGETDIDEFFAGSSKTIVCDGVVDLTIAGRQHEVTPARAL